MKTSIFLSLVISFLMIYSNPLYSKPAEPIVKGGYKKCMISQIKFETDSLLQKYVEIYDDHGNQIEMISNEDDNTSHKIKISNKYNSDGLLSDVVYFSENGNAVVKFKKHYDTRKNLVSVDNFGRNDELTQIDSYKYDENDYLVEETHTFYMDYDTITGVTRFINDKYGNPIEELANHSTEMSLDVSSEVDLSNNQVSSQVQTEQSEQNSDKIRYEYNYNDKGQIIKKIRHGIGGTKLIYVYSYDEFGNILTQISFDENEKPTIMTVFDYSK